MKFFWCEEKRQTRGESKSKKKETKRGAGSSRVFFSERIRERIFEGKGKKGLRREFASSYCLRYKEKLHAKRKDTNKSCARVVKLLLHGTTTVTTTLLHCSPLRSF